MTRPAIDPARARLQQLAWIHKAKKVLDLDDDTYRAFLEGVTGKRSSADMTTAERNAVLAEFARKGFKAEEHAGRKRVWDDKPKGELSPMLRKVEALLADAKREWAYAHGVAKQMFGTTRVEWLRPDQLHKLVSAMQIDANRRRGVK